MDQNILMGVLSTVVACTILLGGYILHDTSRRLAALETTNVQIAKDLATLIQQGKNLDEQLDAIAESVNALPCRDQWDPAERRCKD